MNNIRNYLSETTGLEPESIGKIFLSLAFIIFLYLFQLIVLRIVWSQTKNIKIRYQWKRSLSFILPFVGLIIIGAIWIQAFQQFGAFLGLLSAGLAIALKDPLTNLAGWFFIVFRHPFVVGDRVQMGEHAGDVIDIRLFQFTILEINNWVEADQSTGRIIHLPNGKIFTEPQINYSTGFNYIWNEMKVRITFESNWEKAREILQNIVNRRAENIDREAEREIFEASKNFLIHYTHLTPFVYTTVKEFGIQFSIRYLCNPRRRRGTENEIWQDVLTQFRKHDDIWFAYPTTRFYTRDESLKNSPFQPGD
jgi:small-conductance mechanosensitive channel